MADSPLILHTECKHCSAVLQVTAQQLREGGGKARCSTCERVFDAVAGLKDSGKGPSLPPTPAGGAGLQLGSPGDPFGTLSRRALDAAGGRDDPRLGMTADLPVVDDAALDDARVLFDADLGDDTDEGATRRDRVAMGRADAVPNLDETAIMDASIIDEMHEQMRIDDDLPPPAAAGVTPRPAITRPRDGAPGDRNVGMFALASLGLALMLVAQFIYFETPRVLTSFPQSRPLVSAVCGKLGCELPPQINLSKFVFAERNVREHPVHGNALEVRARLDNLADHPQPLPRIELILFDQVGAELSRRAFNPAEYAGADAHATLEAAGTVDVALDVVSADKDAANFELRVRQ